MLMSRLPYFAAGLVKPGVYLAICFSLQSIRQMDKLYTMLVTSSASSRCFAYELRIIENHTLCLLLSPLRQREELDISFELSTPSYYNKAY